MRNKRDFVPRLCISTCSRRIKLRSAYILCYFIRKRRYSLGVCLGFLQCGIPHRTCRFYCCLAAHQRTKEMDSAGVPLLYPLDSNSSPWGIRCGGVLLLPRVWDNIGSCIPVLSLLASSEFYLAICVRAGIVRVSVGLLGLYLSFL